MSWVGNKNCSKPTLPKLLELRMRGEWFCVSFVLLCLNKYFYKRHFLSWLINLTRDVQSLLNALIHQNYCCFIQVGRSRLSILPRDTDTSFGRKCQVIAIEMTKRNELNFTSALSPFSWCVTRSEQLTKPNKIF